MRVGILGMILALICIFGIVFGKNLMRHDQPDAFSDTQSCKVYGKVIATCKSDLDLDGTQETIAITSRANKDGHPLDGSVIVMQESMSGPKVIGQKEGLNPWKLQVADVDADGKKEIALGVWKKSPKDPIMAKRVFIYNWDGKQMRPKWLGSKLSRRFEDFKFRDINNDGWDELLALEVSPHKPNRVGIYRWKSFGFEWLRSAEPGKWEELTK